MKRVMMAGSRMTWVGKAAAIVLFQLCFAGASQAAWEGDEKPEFGNAYTLRSGEWQVGFLRPTSVGLTDRLQLSTVLLGNALGIVNGALDLNVIRTDNFALSISGHGIADVSDGTGGAGGGLTATVPIGAHLLLSASGGYFSYRGEADPVLGELVVDTARGIRFGGEVELLLDPHNLLFWSASSSYDLDSQELSPGLVGFGYAHAWDTFRLMVGVAFKTDGPFVIEGDDPGDSELELPAMPMIDFWWRW